MNVTEKCDIYSFGVVLLELLTGRRPIQPVEEGGDLVTWVKEAMQMHKSVSRVFDTRLDLTDVVVIEEMLLVLKVALFCTSSLPSERPTMREVVRMLMEASTRKARDSTDTQSVDQESIENSESVREFIENSESVREFIENSESVREFIEDAITEEPISEVTVVTEEPITEEPVSEEPVSDKP